MSLILILSFLLLELCPNPHGPDDAEYVRFYCSDECVFTDNETSLKVSEGFYVATKNSKAFKETFGYDYDAEILEVTNLSLSNSGEEVCLIAKELKDCFNYSKMLLDNGIVYFRKGETWDFRYQDWSSFSCVSDFVEGELTISPTNLKIDLANYSVASYTFFVKQKPKELFLDAKAKNPCMEANFLKGSYRNFHYKFAVSEEDVWISTENWVFTKKGYILHFKNENFASTLKSLLEHDKKFLSNQSSCVADWEESKTDKEGKKIKFYTNVTLAIIPDCNLVFDLLESAKERLVLIAPYIDTDLILEHVRKSDANVTIVMSKEYAKDAEKLRSYGYDVKLIEKLHGKAIVSDDKVLITSANFNIYGFKLNREIAVLIESKEVADFIVSDILKAEEFKPSPLVITLPALAFAIAAFLLWKNLRA